MGAKQSKIEGTYLPATPIYQTLAERQAITVDTKYTVLAEEIDPRSPSGCRTPITLFHPTRSIHTKDQSLELDAKNLEQTPFNFKNNPLGVLRKRFLKSFAYNLNDPRSPSSQLNRTPLTFDEAGDKTLDLDDTFADLLVETRPSTEEIFIEEDNLEKPQIETMDVMQEDVEDVEKFPADCKKTHALNTTESLLQEVCTSSILYEEEETMFCTAALQKTPEVLKTFDPRSPSVGVDRTPIIFNDDDEAGEDALLENILATLSLDVSNASSMVSFGTPPSTPKSNSSSSFSLKMTTTTLPRQATNKHLQRVHAGVKRLPPRQLTRAQRQNIYEDRENVIHCVNFNSNSTPKKSESNADVIHKRTPLSCVKNRAHLRSRSVESSSVKALKVRLSLTSFDDSLNAVQNGKVANLRIMQDTKNKL